MKIRTLIIAVFSLSLSCMAVAQSGKDYWKKRYDTQVKNLGPAGIGVETIIGKWEAECPDDPEVHYARFAYNYTKSYKEVMVQKDQPRYLGNRPTLTLKDSLGNDVFYYQDLSFDEELFSEALNSIDKAMSLDSKELRYYIDKIAVLMAYEKESPDMAFKEINALLDREISLHPQWHIDAVAADKNIMEDVMQELSASLYLVGTDTAYEMFYELSKRLASTYKHTSVFLSNIGSYWLVAKNNQKKAKSFYKKALKLNPEDYSAKENLKLIQSLQSRKGQPSK